ncbi:MAG: agmatine deiminase family protein [Leptospiraceae bacterium]|nr:agmatine deiminase family protein [Leptospiraceae bacterium]
MMESQSRIPNPTERSADDSERTRRRLPAEWEPHAATWVSWPHRPELWPGHFPQARAAWATCVAALSRHETVRVLIPDARMETEVRAVLQNTARGAARPDRVELHVIATDDIWIRDYGPLWFQSDGPADSVLQFGFNAWGEKFTPYHNDHAAGASMAAITASRLFECAEVVEGGGIEWDGRGLFLSVADCVLLPSRRHGLDRPGFETLLRTRAGLRRMIWLERGLPDDDTDGHIDLLARFVAPGIVLAARTKDDGHPAHAVLEANYAELRRKATAGEIELHALPHPAPVYHEGRLLSRSYANFYIANDCVLLPVYADRADERARAVLEEFFPDREIIPVNCN